MVFVDIRDCGTRAHLATRAHLHVTKLYLYKTLK